MTGIYLRLILATLFWGGTFIAGRMVSQEIAPYSAAFIRFAVASLLLLALVIHQEGRLPALTRSQLLTMIMLGSTGVFFYNVLFFSALQSIEAGRAALIITTNPVFIALFSFFLFGERFSPMRLAGIALSITGAMVVISRGSQIRYLVPVSAVSLGVLILGEAFGFSLLVGGCMVLTGLILTNGVQWRGRAG
ncbi:MAG: DMT family transporter [Gammaproteobacteria bacterium]|nr:DMT family transporter [Gammaproteobacteria bacterium]